MLPITDTRIGTGTSPGYPQCPPPPPRPSTLPSARRCPDLLGSRALMRFFSEPRRDTLPRAICQTGNGSPGGRKLYPPRCLPQQSSCSPEASTGCLPPQTVRPFRSGSPQEMAQRGEVLLGAWGFARRVLVLEP